MRTNSNAAPAGTADAAHHLSPAASAAESAAASAAVGAVDGPRPVIRPREEHTISRRDIDPDALRVLYRLARNNFTAYLVGGGVRDLLLGRKPKDFDISTNARPEQIRSLFRNCILIGRRFRLAHIRYGEKIIETSTFRGCPAASADPADPEADLFQRDDNLFGSPQEDALRRDFTVNGLFYDISTFSIIDYAGGLDDLAARRIRCIGDPGIRFREDPVRMVRAVRFASRLGFSLEAETEEAIRKHGPELAKAAPARLLEEITRLFAFSSGEKAVRLLHSTGLLGVLLPEVASALAAPDADHALFWRRLAALDNGDTVLPEATPALIFATLLLDALQLSLGKRRSMREGPRLKFERVHAFLEPLAARLRFPRRMVDRIVHMYLAQSRLHERADVGKRGSISNFVTQESFHEALALAEIVVTSEGAEQAGLSPWRDMLAERLFGGDAVAERQGAGHGQGQNHGQNQNRSQNHGHGQDGGNGGETAGASGGEGGGNNGGGERLSRSARRRRSKRRRRMTGQGNAPAATTHTTVEMSAAPQSAPVASSAAAPVVNPKPVTTALPAPAAALPSPSPSAPAGEKPARPARRTRRGGEGKKEGAAAQKAVAQKSATDKPAAETHPDTEKSDAAIVPLTAAAFYMSPPEPEEKPKRARRGRSASAAKPKETPAPPASSAVPGARSRPAPDKADDADTPLHWLDEI